MNAGRPAAIAVVSKALVLARSTDDLSVNGIDGVFRAIAAVCKSVGAVIVMVLAIDAEIGCCSFGMH